MNLINRKKEKRLRKEKYEELNKLFKNKHQIICNWKNKKYGGVSDTIEGINFANKFYCFFVIEYGHLPGSFNEFSSVNFSFDTSFDSYPVEKLQKLYNSIEILFPEPFIQINRLKKLKILNTKKIIVKYVSKRINRKNRGIKIVIS